ncbi:LPS export ABC transporter periplasmic protein LptC, partial [Pseudomonas syringae pv. tagetis]|uniref:LPS export ABC transporter periplasmic protein LptC n=1 Tax=Pseudomonas syringae group genomosp. 7 TaxID=251699 RepID=UPI00377003DA
DHPGATVDDTFIDYYAINAHSVQFLPDGTIQYYMTSDKVEHVKATDVTLLTTPDLHMYSGGEFPWNVQSKKREVSSGGE